MRNLMAFSVARLALLTGAISSCGTGKLSETSDEGAPVERESASARIEAIRARFGATAIADTAVLRYEPLGGGRVHPVVAAIDRGSLARAARVELPSNAHGEVVLEDEASHVAIRFARVSAVAEKLELARGGLAVYGDLVHRVRAEGTEDFVSFERRPTREELVYRVDVRRVAGLRLVGNTLEFLDVTGTPRLRVAPPYVLDAAGARHDAVLAVEGCKADADPRAPWERAVVAPGAAECLVRVTWHDVSYPALVDPVWVTTGSMTAPRWNHGAVRLDSGKVLIAGGETPGGFLSTAELFDGTGTFAATGSLPATRCRFTTTRLPSGKILVVGGECGPGLTVHSSAVLYDESAGTFAATGSLNVPRQEHTATLLPSGKVLIAGGCKTPGYTTTATPQSTAELYDGSAFTNVGSMKAVHCGHVAALLPSGKVLVAGGAYAYADLFDGVSAFTAVGSLSTGRGYAQALTLSSGKVLVAGGRNVSLTAQYSTTEIFDGSGFAAGPTMGSGRHRFAMLQLATGRILAVGGESSGTRLSAAEYFDGTSFAAIAAMSSPRAELTATLLKSGRVLVAGGRAVSSDPNANTAELLTQPGLAGDACTGTGDCASGACRGGYCCADACTGSCKKCLPGSGTCSPLVSADDPLSCTGSNTCDATGTCKLKNGQAATAGSNCASGFAADGYCCNTACGAACDSCANSGKLGTCSVAAGYPGSPACAPYLCQATATCPTSCTTDAHCVSTSFCQGGVCTSKKSSGATCASGARECANGFCVDGYCCNTACTGNCSACSAAVSGVVGSNGTCTLVANGLRGHGECGPTSCSSSTTVASPVCNGSGSCTTKSTSCGSFACTGGACASACSTDTDCGVDTYCAGTTCAPKKTPGTACASASSCLSGNCVDGVCCSSACTGACEACGETASKGTCVAVTGTPRGTHPACNGVGTSCAGTCDGANRAVCSYPTAGIACGSGCTGGSLSVCSTSGSCLSAIACPGNLVCASATACKTACLVDGDCTSSAYCSGTACLPKSADGSTCSNDNQCANGHCVAGVCCATACTAYACKTDGSACRSTCASDAECTSSSYCVGSACTTRKANGVACTGGSECSSGNCVDSVCCDRACGGTCEACIATKSGVAGSNGTCTFINDGKDPDAECGTPTCTGSVLNANVCNGTGVCRASVTDCGSAKCVVSGASGVCENTCTTDGDCGVAGFCKSGTCAPKVERAAACASNVECKSGFCVDGVCCNEACSGQCQACGEPGSPGTCLAVKGKPRGTRTDCNGSGGACYGQCDGINLAACGYPSAGQGCGTGCADGKASVCDATGVCLEPAACAGNFACDGTTKCKTSCTLDDECAAGFACAAGKCVPKAEATCSQDGTQSIPSGDAGAPQSCAPYRCLATGACGNKCTTTNDCADGNTCDTATQQCTGTAASTDDGGGCMLAGSGGSASAAWIAALLLALIARRGRRSSVVAGPERERETDDGRAPVHPQRSTTPARRRRRVVTDRAARTRRPSARSARERA